MTDNNNLIPYGEYELKIGDSFKKNDRTEYHTLKVDFKPKSITPDQDTYIAFNSKGDVHVVVPGEESTVAFKGSKKPTKSEKECLLIFDKNTGQLRLEKLTSNIHLKNMRKEEQDDAVSSEIFELHAKKMQQRRAMEQVNEISYLLEESENNTLSDADSSESDSESDLETHDDHQQQMDLESEPNSGGESADEMEKTREVLTVKPVDSDRRPTSWVGAQNVALQRHLNTFQNDYKPVVAPPTKPSAPSSSKTKDVLHDDLQLSESDNDSE